MLLPHPNGQTKLNLIIIRHTPVSLEAGICYGKSNISLSEDYLSHFNKVWLNLKKLCEKKNINLNSLAFHTSPLDRCYHLASFLSKDNTDNNIIPDDRLTEYNFGEWELKPWDEIYKNKLSNKWFEQPLKTCPPNGEYYEYFRYRVLESFKEIKNSHNIQGNISTPCIITHAAPIRVILSHVNNVAPYDSLALSVRYGEIFYLKI
jgi:alpha-ribazole phosphatase